MKICFLTQTLDPTVGYGRYAADIIAGIKNVGHDVVILKEREDGYEGYPILARGGGVFLAAWKARRYIKNCDIVHALDGYPYGVIAALARIGTRAKLVISAQGTYAVAPLYRWQTAALLRWAYRSARRVIAISRYTRQEILKRVSLKNLRVINHGIDLVRFFHEHQNVGEPFILSVGAVEDRKGYHISIPAFARIAREFPDLKYYIVGRKEMWYVEQVQRLIAEERLQDRVVFLEGLSDKALADLYAAARLFVLASMNIERFHFEGFGLVYLEAAAAGTPVIGTLGSGPEDAVDNGNNGLLVPQGDVDATASAMRNILSDPSRWAAMSEAGYHWAKRHSLVDVVKRYNELYRLL